MEFLTSELNIKECFTILNKDKDSGIALCIIRYYHELTYKSLHRVHVRNHESIFLPISFNRFVNTNSPSGLDQSIKYMQFQHH